MCSLNRGDKKCMQHFDKGNVFRCYHLEDPEGDMRLIVKRIFGRYVFKM
jgi:hypothetical protein